MEMDKQNGKYAILIKYGQSDEFVPVPSGYSKMPDGGCFKWDDAVELMDRMLHNDPFNQYMIMEIN